MNLDIAVWRYLGIICLLLYLFPALALAQQDRTNLELIESIKSLTLASDIYSDTANIKSLAVLFLSSEDGNTRNSDNNKFADSIMKFLWEFNTIFQKSRNDQPEDHKEGVKKAIELRDETAYLGSLSRSSAKLGASITGIVNNENTSLNRFLIEQAKYFENLAGKEDAVPLIIEYLEYSAKAYQGSGDEEYEIVKKKHAEKEANFNRDMVQALDFSKKADEIISDLKKDERGLFNLFSGYIKSRDAIKNYLNAREIYHNNGISDKTLQKLPKNYEETYNELVTENRNAEEISSMIFKSLIISLLEILIPLFLVFIIFMSGFRVWKKDFADAKLNKVIRKG